MTNHFESIDLVQLSCVTGGADASPQQPQPPQQQAPGQRPQLPQSPQPQGGGNLGWISNTANCARIGGPVLGAVCGALTPTPAY